MRGRIAVLCLLVLCPVLSAGAAVQAYSGIVAFGDSLTDNGPADGYGLGISSNGRVWVDYLAEQLGVELLDMAYGSAETNYHPATGSARWGFCWQIDEYLHQMASASDDKLYIIWIGGNDLLKRTDDPRPTVDRAVANIVYGIDRLIGAGARYILVMNLPNLGLTPMMNGQNLHMNGQGLRYRFVDDPGGGTRLAAAFNAALEHALRPYESAASLMVVDIFALTNRFVAEGVFDDAIHMLMVSQPTDKSFMFWDSHHPTDDAHRRIAAAAYRALSADLQLSVVMSTGIGWTGPVGARHRGGLQPGLVPLPPP